MFTSPIYWAPFILGTAMLLTGLILFIIRPEKGSGGHEADFKAAKFSSSNSSIILLFIGSFIMLISLTGLKTEGEPAINNTDTNVGSDSKVASNHSSQAEPTSTLGVNPIQQTSMPAPTEQQERNKVSNPSIAQVPIQETKPHPKAETSFDSSGTNTAPLARLYFCKYINNGQESDCRDNYICIVQTRFYMIIEAPASIGTDKVRYRLSEIVKGAYHIIEDQVMEVNSHSTKFAFPMVFFRAGSFYVEAFNERGDMLAAAPVIIN